VSIEAKGPTLKAAPPGSASFWAMDRVAAALDGETASPAPRGAHVFGRVWTDTRTLQSGDLFVALSGDRFDAHDFLADAVKAGAAAVVVSRVEKTKGLGVPVYHVRDARAALGALGRYRRRAWNGPVVAVVGSNGKTSTKELIRAALESRLEVHATTGNLNNLVGVPLTLLAIPDYADIAVVEMGTNHPGEIATLRAIVEPNITVVTSIGEEHLEGLGDLAGVMREELSACDGVAVAIVPASQPDVVAAAKTRANRVVAAGSDDVTFDVPLKGAHNVRNAGLAVAVARDIGISLEDAARGIASIKAPPMRSNVEQIGGVTLINDAYNANPGSARAALEMLAGYEKGRQRVAILGSMLELGPTSPALHDEIARRAVDAGFDIIAGVGEFAAALQRVGAPSSKIVTAADAEAIWTPLSSRLQRDAVILLKGSRGVRLERLVPHITRWAQGVA
jgi:UDP-N-acetylmuramoyl-tripeptide--D-alanyl-D-alanine ligase